MITNYKDFKKFIENQTTKPTLLVHACCGPCSTHTLKLLQPYFDITVYYSNSNIDTIDEFNKRAIELQKVCQYLEDIKVIIDDYIPSDYYKSVKGKEHLGEFSSRCDSCMEFRMRHTAIYAKVHGFDFFTTTLSISPYKSSESINKIGYMLQEELDMPFLYSNFKKEEGYKDSVKMSYELGLYRQEYCGCVFSLKEAEGKSHG